MTQMNLLPLAVVSLILLPTAAFAAGNATLPVEVFMKGENITGFNPAGDKRSYYCFRIPQLLALPSGKLLAFAEGRADGCRPDGHVNRPIVVRSSSDRGATWGPISIAGPALPHLGTNYPGAYIRDNNTIALRYSLSNGTVFETVSITEGESWSLPVVASQPVGNIRCGSAWPKMLGSDIVMPCAAGHTARSSDGGRSWKLSTKPVALDTNVTGVTGLGEAMAIADGRSATSLTMMIRAGSRNSRLNHAIARSEE